ncbi:MAG: hypothetical protein DRP00_02940 [Candidatus Aenigmatarchaeota archaeon]|nr:MAG: hypothetical protein DRP00_02940 [Candidatus Aenigmarchaeota archaeon]
MIDEYLKRADEMDERGWRSTAYYLRLDAYYRKFFGNENWVPPSIPPPKPKVNTEIMAKYAEEDEVVDIETRRLKVYVQGWLVEKDTGEPVANAVIKIVSKLDGSEIKEYETTTDEEGEFTQLVEYEADLSEHTVHIDIKFDGMETDEKVYLPSECCFDVKFPERGFKTQIILLGVEKRTKKWNPWLEVFEVAKRFKVKVLDTGWILKPKPEEIAVKVYDKTGRHNLGVKILEDGTVEARGDVYVPGLRSSTYDADCSIEFKPEKKQVEGCRETEKIEFKQNYASWWWAVIIIIIWIISMLLSAP